MVKGKAVVTIGEPSMVNLASEAALKVVAENVRQLCLTGGRKWTMIHSDGVPYVQLAEMQDNIFKCTRCEVELEKGISKTT